MTPPIYHVNTRVQMAACSARHRSHCGETAGLIRIIPHGTLKGDSPAYVLLFPDKSQYVAFNDEIAKEIKHDDLKMLSNLFWAFAAWLMHWGKP